MVLLFQVDTWRAAISLVKKSTNLKKKKIFSKIKNCNDEQIVNCQILFCFFLYIGAWHHSIGNKTVNHRSGTDDLIFRITGR
jgi:hypothetical protein